MKACQLLKKCQGLEISSSPNVLGTRSRMTSHIGDFKWLLVCEKTSSGLVLSFAWGGEGLPPPCPGCVLVPIYNAMPWD
jgi:hypothetical protein